MVNSVALSMRFGLVLRFGSRGLESVRVFRKSGLVSVLLFGFWFE